MQKEVSCSIYMIVCGWICWFLDDIGYTGSIWSILSKLGDFVVIIKPASNDLGVYVNKFGKTSVVWR